MKKFASYFMQGLVFVAPLAITVYIYLYDFRLYRRPASRPAGLVDRAHRTEGLGLLLIVGLLTLLGFLGEYIVFNPFKRIWGTTAQPGTAAEGDLQFAGRPVFGFRWQRKEVQQTGFGVHQ